MYKIKHGSIGLWSKNFKLLNSFQIYDKTLDSSNIYVTDAIFLNQNNRICVSTSKNELKFFSISTESIIYDFNIIGLSSMPTCMDYCYDVFNYFLIDSIF